ncbi:MAG: magnesium transporter, partial [Acutalibacteraceae bacterium]
FSSLHNTNSNGICGKDNWLCVLPMLAKKIGFDPAVMASPFITTAVDAISLVVYFQIAAVLLNLAL